MEQRPLVVVPTRGQTASRKERACCEPPAQGEEREEAEWRRAAACSAAAHALMAHVDHLAGRAFVACGVDGDEAHAEVDHVVVVPVVKGEDEPVSVLDHLRRAGEAAGALPLTISTR